jgi:hypothetical protein
MGFARPCGPLLPSSSPCAKGEKRQRTAAALPNRDSFWLPIVAFREEAAAGLARRNAVGPPLRVGMLRQNLRAFAHAEVFVEGLIKAGVEEKGLLLAREAGLAHCWRPSSGVGSLDAGERLGAGPGRIQAQRPYPVPGIRRLKRRHDRPVEPIDDRIWRPARRKQAEPAGRLDVVACFAERRHVGQKDRRLPGRRRQHPDPSGLVQLDQFVGRERV